MDWMIWKIAEPQTCHEIRMEMHLVKVGFAKTMAFGANFKDCTVKGVTHDKQEKGQQPWSNWILVFLIFLLSDIEKKRTNIIEQY